MQIPQHREPLETALGRSLCFVFSLFACTDPLSTKALLAREQSAERRARHIPGERMRPSADAAPCRKPFPLSFCWFICFVFCSCKETRFHIIITKKSTVFQTSMFVLFLCFLKNLPLGPYYLLQRRGGVEK